MSESIFAIIINIFYEQEEEAEIEKKCAIILAIERCEMKSKRK